VEEDENTGLTTFRVINDKKGKLHPQLLIFGADKDKPIGRYAVPANALLQVRDGTKIGVGEILVKMPRQASATRDITGGLPRVAELFEARVPKAPAVVTAVDGIVEFGDMERGQQKVIVVGENNSRAEYLIPRGKHLSVHSGDRVRAGDRLCEGPKDPHDILRIGGEKAVQEYLVDEIQAVYKLQGVTIADKHIECIVRQMLRKVKVRDPGDSQFLENEEVSKARLRLEIHPPAVDQRRHPHHRAVAAGHHQGVARNRLVLRCGLLPGDHQGPHPGGRRGPHGHLGRPQGERHRRSADPLGNRMPATTARSGSGTRKPRWKQPAGRRKSWKRMPDGGNSKPPSVHRRRRRPCRRLRGRSHPQGLIRPQPLAKQGFEHLTSTP
jgi:hypothetical protein